MSNPALRPSTWHPLWAVLNSYSGYSWIVEARPGPSTDATPQPLAWELLWDHTRSPEPCCCKCSNAANEGALALVSQCTSIQLLSTVYLVLFAMRVS